MSLTGNNNINEGKLKQIEFEIFKLEDENAKTKNYKDSEMVEKIKQIIKNGVDGKLK